MKLTQALRLNYEFRRVYKSGKFAHGRYLTLYLRRPKGSGRFLGVTVSRDNEGACQRNRIKRRLRALYAVDELTYTAPYELVMLGRAPAADADFSVLQKEYRRLASKLRLAPSSPENLSAKQKSDCAD